MFCRKCGKEIPDTAKFCTVCGAPATANGQSDTTFIAEDAENRGKRTGWFIGIGLASALAIIIVGVFVFRTGKTAVSTDSVSPVISELQPPESEQEVMVKTGFVTQNGELYYYDTDGEPASGWFEESGSRYYAAAEGQIYRNGTFEIDGIPYVFDETGICIGDEITFAEEDAKLLQTLNGESNLAVLLSGLAHKYLDGSAILNDTITSETVQASMNCLLHGEPEGIEDLFAGDITLAQGLGYPYENMPPNIDELCQQYGNDYYLTKEQIEYLVFSICGKQVDVDMSYDAGWHDPYLGFGGAAGDSEWHELDNFTVERIDADTWQITADVYYGSDGLLFLYTYMQDYMEFVAKICFTATKNPDSYFDGYSVTDVRVELQNDDSAWVRAYVNYIENFEQELYDQIHDIVSDYGMDAQEEEELRAQISYDLIYIDNDDIPELYIEYPMGLDYSEVRIITYYDGQLIDSSDAFYWLSCEYIERGGLCYGECSRFGEYMRGVYKLENGRWQTLGTGWVHTESPYYEWNNTEVSSDEEIERNVNEIYDKTHSKKCRSMSALEVIKLICQDQKIKVVFREEKPYVAENDLPDVTTPNKIASNGIISNGIRYFTNNEEFEAALTQEQYDLWVQLAGPTIYARYGGQLYFEGFDGVVLRASSDTSGVTVTYSDSGLGIVVTN